MLTPVSACQDQSSERTAAERKGVEMAAAVVSVVEYVDDSLAAAGVGADVLAREPLEVREAAHMTMTLK